MKLHEIWDVDPNPEPVEHFSASRKKAMELAKTISDDHQQERDEIIGMLYKAKTPSDVKKAMERINRLSPHPPKETQTWT